jgi:hypothetical protein
MSLPNLSNHDRREALEKATEARHLRALLREEIKEGKVSVRDILDREDDSVAGRMKVSMLLESLPGYGKAKAARVMEELDISSSRRIQGLGKCQKQALLERFDGE